MQTAGPPSVPEISSYPPTALVPLTGFRPVGAPKDDYRRFPDFSAKFPLACQRNAGACKCSLSPTSPVSAAVNIKPAARKQSPSLQQPTDGISMNIDEIPGQNPKQAELIHVHVAAVFPTNYDKVFCRKGKSYEGE